jgi:hypothetical protein
MLEYKSRGHLELQKRYGAAVTWTSDYGTQRPGASGLKGSNLLTILFYSQAMEVYGGLYVKIHGFRI